MTNGGRVIKIFAIGWAAFLLAALCGCGGGGGGSIAPATTATATPTAPSLTVTVTGPTATPSPASTTTPPSATAAVGPAAQSVTVVNQSNSDASSIVGFPQTTSGSGSITLAESSAILAGAPVPQSLRRVPAAIGGALYPVAYLSLTPSTTVSFAATPSFVFNLGIVPAIVLNASYYLGLYDSSNPAAGWTTVAGPALLSGSKVTFPSLAQQLTLKTGVSYLYAVFATAQALAPATSAQIFAGGGTLNATLTNVPAAAHSAVLTFAAVTGAPASTLVTLPASCNSAACAVTLSAPAGANQTLQLLIFASADGTGQGLAVGSATVSMFINQSTALNVALNGIMASYSVVLSPAVVTLGQATPIQVGERALDAAGDVLSAGFVTPALTAPAFATAVSDPTSLSSTTEYSGVGSGPITYSVQSPGYAQMSATLQVTPSTPATIAIAVQIVDAINYRCDIQLIGRTSGTGREYVMPCGVSGNAAPPPHFDQNGVLWVAAQGINPDGTSAGTLTLPGTLLAFDLAGKAYVTTQGTQTLSVYSGNTLVRQLNFTSAPTAVVVDPSGNVFVSFGNVGLYEYGPTGTGSVTPIGYDAHASAPFGLDSSGTLYATTSLGVGVWPAGSYGVSSPVRTISGEPTVLVVAPPGDIYAFLLNPSQQVSTVPPGGSSFVVYTGPFAGRNVSGTLAVPLR